MLNTLEKGSTYTDKLFQFGHQAGKCVKWNPFAHWTGRLPILTKLQSAEDAAFCLQTTD